MNQDDTEEKVPAPDEPGSKLPTDSTPWYQEYWTLLTLTFAEWNADNIGRLAAALAYYALFSLAPLLVIAVGIAGMVLGQEVAQGTIVEQVRSYTGNQGTAELVQTLLENTQVQGPNILATVFTIALLFYGATGAFTELRNALNLIWDVPDRETGGVTGFIVGRAIALTMVVGAGLLLLLSVVASAAIAFAANYIDRLWPGTGWISQVLAFLLLFVLTVLVFALIYKYVPEVELAWSDVWIGALATGLLFSVGRWGIAFYLSTSDVGSVYGAAGSVILVLIWVNYSALAFFLGAEFTQVFGRLRGSRVAEETLIAEPEMTHAPVTVETEEGIIVPAMLVAEADTNVDKDEHKDAEPGAQRKDVPLAAHAKPEPGRLRRAGRAAAVGAANVAAAVTVIGVLSAVSLIREPFRRDARRQPSRTG